MLSDQRPQPDEGFHSQPASDTNSQPGDHDYGLAETDDIMAQSKVDDLRSQILDLPLATRLRKSDQIRPSGSQATT